MSRVKRVCLVLFAFVLLPIGPARAEPKEETYWSGTVINKISSQSNVVNPPDPSHNYGGYTFAKYERYVRKITALGNGYAQEEVWYTFRTEYTRACNYIQDPTWYGTQTVTRDGYSISVPKPFSVIRTDSWVVVGFVLTPVDAVTKEVDSCTGVETNGTMPIQTQALLTLTSENGEFSADSTEVWGYAPGYNDYLPAGPLTATTGWQFNSSNTFYNLSAIEVDTPYLSQEDKAIYWKASDILGRTAKTQILSAIYHGLRGRLHRAGGHAIVSISASTAQLIDGLLALDPPDPNFTEIAAPVTPATSQQPILPGDDFTQAQADAFNALLNNLQQGIGLGRAILTSFNRASGAQLANDSYWMAQQLQAARTYAGQYADVLDARPQAFEDMKQSFGTDPDEQFEITSEDLAQYEYDLVTNGFSTEQEQLLIELGVDERGRAEILHDLILAELPQEATLQDPVARFPDLLTDPDLIQATQDLANSLREFAEGAGSRIYLPLVTN